MSLKPFIAFFIFFPLIVFANYKIVFVGDSITQGGFEFSEINYVELIKDQLKKDNLNAVLIKYACAATPTAISLTEMLNKLPKDLPDLVVINSGIVDAIYDVPSINVKSNLSKMIDLCLKHNAKVILGAIDISCWRLIKDKKYISDINGIFKDLAYEYPITTFPFLNNVTLGNNKYNHGDLVHPNQNGDQLICDFLYPEISKHLREKPV